MTVPITKEVVAAVYELCRVTPPFIGWKLPPVEEIGIIISKAPKHYGQQWSDGEKHWIEISVANNGYLPTLIGTVQHEMIHMVQRMKGTAPTKHGPDKHNADYKRRAHRVCKIHGHDPKGFF